jgi:protein-tyrosine phosphatase
VNNNSENNQIIESEIDKLPSSYSEEDKKFNEKFYHDTYSSIDEIIPRLYLSNDFVARNRKILNDNHITHILNLTTNIPNLFEPEIIYKKFIIFDFENQNISLYFDEAFEFIDTALSDENNSVLVHCNAGISRSASFVIAYLMKKKICKNYKEAVSFTRQKRSIINPNKGFERQLIRLEKKKKKFKCNIM